VRKILEGSMATAEAVAACRPNVISAYPITPQTHIVEDLAQMVADGSLDAVSVNVESEHSAASVVLGASLTGARSYTATSSQGLLLMGEVLFNISGMRAPVVMACANRAVSAPISIWNDQQDSIALRDAGWIQLYAETRYAIHETLCETVPIITEVSAEFERVFGRKSGGLLESYKMDGAEQVLVAMGSLAGNVKEVVDDLRDEGQKVGLLRLITYRPFPTAAILDALSQAKSVGVLDKDISLGYEGAVATDLKSAFHGHPNPPMIRGFVLGLGGRDVPKATIRKVFDKLEEGPGDVDFIDIHEDVKKLAQA